MSVYTVKFFLFSNRSGILSSQDFNLQEIQKTFPEALFKFASFVEMDWDICQKKEMYSKWILLTGTGPSQALPNGSSL